MNFVFILLGVRPSAFRGAFYYRLAKKYQRVICCISASVPITHKSLRQYRVLKRGHNSLLVITPPKNLNYSLLNVTLTLAVNVWVVGLRALLYNVKVTSEPLR